MTPQERAALVAEWKYRLPGLSRRWVEYAQGDTLMDRDDIEFINAFSPAVVSELLAALAQTEPKVTT